MSFQQLYLSLSALLFLMLGVVWVSKPMLNFALKVTMSALSIAGFVLLALTYVRAS